MVYAIDVKSGRQLWKFTPDIKLGSSPGASWSARTNRGVALLDGNVFVGTGDCRMIAIDATTGVQVWESPVCDTSATFGGMGGGVTGAPSVGDGKVFIGHSGSEMGTRGSVVAFDAKTGKQLWRFWTVPGAPGTQYESEAMRKAGKTWPSEHSDAGGGVVWDAITYDAQTNQLFFGTGSSLPYSHSLKGAGDRLYTDSIVAVDAASGEYRWHYQTVPEDSWDFDASMHVLVTDLTIDGKQQRVAMQAPKNGFFYVLDAVTGELLSADPAVPVNWATHVDLKSGRPVLDQAAQYSRWPDRKTLVYPSANGGHNWQAMSFNPELGLVYLGVSDLGSYWSVNDQGDGVYDNTNYGPDGRPLLNNGRLVAWDPLKKAPRWQVGLKFPYNGGTLATAGGLVFFGETTGRFAAYNGATGEVLWQLEAGAPIGGNPATAMVDGDQYVLVNAGEGTAMSYANNPEMTRNGPESIGISRVMAFRLGGQARLAADQSNPPRLQQPARKPSTPAAVVAGKQLWKASGCASCHGARASSRGMRALNGGIPDLRYAPAEVHDMWLGIVFGGRADKGMPNFAGLIEIEQANLIQQYVLFRTWESYCAQSRAAGDEVPKFCNEIKSGTYSNLLH